MMSQTAVSRIWRAIVRQMLWAAPRTIGNARRGRRDKERGDEP